VTSKPGTPGWWGGGRATKASDYCKRVYGFTCWLCGHDIAADDYSVDHVVERRLRPDLTWEPSNWRPCHRTKKPEFDCPGNSGRSARGVTYFTEPGW
jgi:hypothetical protein